MKEYFINRVQGLLSRVALSCLGKDFEMLIDWDKKDTYETSKEPRVYIQIVYKSQCNKTGKEDQEWRGAKWYLSEHMTDSEIIFKALLHGRLV